MQLDITIKIRAVLIIFLGGLILNLVSGNCVASSVFGAPSITVIYVDADANGNNNGASWEDAFNYLQDALAIAKENADENDLFEIWVAEGNYYPDEDVAMVVINNNPSESFYLINYVSIYGGFIGKERSREERDWELNRVVLNGDIDQDGQRSGNSHHIFYNPEEEIDPLTNTAVLDGVTITNGSADNFGGALYLSHSSPIITNCIIDNNYALSFGGAIYAMNSSPVIFSCVFQSNQAQRGGGALFATFQSNLLINNCTFKENMSDSTNFQQGYLAGEGGAIMITSTIDSIIISNSNFRENHSFLMGGAIKTFSYIKVVNCDFDLNYSRDGGAIYAAGDSIKIIDSRLNNNTCVSVDVPPNIISAGGAVHLFHGDSEIINTHFSNNISYTQGGALFVERGTNNLFNTTFDNNWAQLNIAEQVNYQFGGGIYIGKQAIVNISKSIFKNNKSEDPGSGVYAGDQSVLNITNSLFYDNQIYSIVYNGSAAGLIVNATVTSTVNNPLGGVRFYSESSPDIYNSIIYGNGCGISGAADANVLHSIVEGGFVNSLNVKDVDPLFVDPGSYDFRLQECSPAIDSGNHSAVLDLFDLDCNNRLFDANQDGLLPTIDMGCYEYQNIQNCDACPEFLVLNGIIEQGVYQASKYIIIAGQVESESSVTLSAPDSVVFTFDSSVGENATLAIENTGCQN